MPRTISTPQLATRSAFRLLEWTPNRPTGTESVPFTTNGIPDTLSRIDCAQVELTFQLVKMKAKAIAINEKRWRVGKVGKLSTKVLVQVLIALVVQMKKILKTISEESPGFPDQKNKTRAKKILQTASILVDGNGLADISMPGFHFFF